MPSEARLFYIVVVLYTLLLLGVAVSGWNWYDVQWFLKWTEYDILHVYEAPKCAYFPLTPLTFVSLYSFAKWLAAVVKPEEPIYLIRLVVKLPLIVSAIVVMILLYRYAGLLPALAWMSSLAVFSNVWSLQYDIIVGLLLLLSCIALLRRPAVAGLLVGLATLYKQAAILCALPHVMYLYTTKMSKRAVVLYLLALVLVIALGILPFYLTTPQEFIEKALLFHAQRLPQDLSIWNVPQLATNYRELIPALRWIWEIPFILSIAVFTVLLTLRRDCLRAGDPLTKVAALSAATLLLLIFWNKVGNPGYILWVLPMLFLAVRNTRYLVLAVIATFFANFVYPWLQCIPAVKLDKGVFIVEDLKYWPAREIVLNSIVGLPIPLQVYIIIPILPHEAKLMQFLYQHFGQLSMVCVILYNTFLLVSLALTLREIFKRAL